MRANHIDMRYGNVAIAYCQCCRLNFLPAPMFVSLACLFTIIYVPAHVTDRSHTLNTRLDCTLACAEIRFECVCVNVCVCLCAVVTDWISTNTKLPPQSDQTHSIIAPIYRSVSVHIKHFLQSRKKIPRNNLGVHAKNTNTIRTDMVPASMQTDHFCSFLISSKTTSFFFVVDQFYGFIFHAIPFVPSDVHVPKRKPISGVTETTVCAAWCTLGMRFHSVIVVVAVVVVAVAVVVVVDVRYDCQSGRQALECFHQSLYCLLLISFGWCEPISWFFSIWYWNVSLQSVDTFTVQ